MGSAINGHENGYDSELELSAPHGRKLHGFLVDVDVAPKEASCIIYGVTADGHTEGVAVKGGHSQVRLPFAETRVYVKHLGCPEHVWISTIGYL
jgi:hypothetical protein